jgi:ribosomal protein S3
LGCLKKSSDREDIDKEKEFLDYLLDKLNLKIIDVLIGGSTVLIKKDDYEININVHSVFNPGIIIGKFGRDINYINRLFNVRVMSIKEVKGTEYSDYITEFRKLFREKMYG